MKTSNTPAARTALAAAFLVLALALVPAAFAGKGTGGTKSGGTGGTRSSGCAISPGLVSLDQVWTVGAWKLPTTSTVNMIINFPDGGQLAGPITVNSDGTFTTTGDSNMSATWGFIPPEQLGTYTYQFVGKLKWPGETFTQLYAACSVVVS
jgi:hypothetical protein